MAPHGRRQQRRQRKQPRQRQAAAAIANPCIMHAACSTAPNTATKESGLPAHQRVEQHDGGDEGEHSDERHKQVLAGEGQLVAKQLVVGRHAGWGCGRRRGQAGGQRATGGRRRRVGGSGGRRRVGWSGAGSPAATLDLTWRWSTVACGARGRCRAPCSEKNGAVSERRQEGLQAETAFTLRGEACRGAQERNCRRGGARQAASPPAPRSSAHPLFDSNLQSVQG